MQKSQWVILFLSLFISASLMAQDKTQRTPDKRGYVVAVGDTVPSLKMLLTDSTSVLMDSLRGKVVMLQFTASWCGVCRKEMPIIEEEIWQPLKDKDFVLIGVDRDEPLETVIEFGEKMNITYPLALDPAADIFGLFAHKRSGVTRNVIIDQEGKIAYLTRLFERTEFDEMKAEIHELLGVEEETKEIEEEEDKK